MRPHPLPSLKAAGWTCVWGKGQIDDEGRGAHTGGQAEKPGCGVGRVEGWQAHRAAPVGKLLLRHTHLSSSLVSTLCITPGMCTPQDSTVASGYDSQGRTYAPRCRAMSAVEGARPGCWRRPAQLQRHPKFPSRQVVASMELSATAARGRCRQGPVPSASVCLGGAGPDTNGHGCAYRTNSPAQWACTAGVRLRLA